MPLMGKGPQQSSNGSDIIQGKETGTRKIRRERMKYKIKLSDEFIAAATKVAPAWGVLGWVTYKRTYARWIEYAGRNEEFHETIKRVVEGNINIDPRLKKVKCVSKKSVKLVAELTKEAQELFEVFYSLQALPPGRGLWISGTDFAAKHGDALNNCWFISTYPQKYGKSGIIPFYSEGNDELVSMAFSFLFDQSMKGGGVGFSVAREHINRIPEVGLGVNLSIICKESNADYNKFADKLSGTEAKEGDLVFVIPDSREGWVESMALVIDAHFNAVDTTNITIDVSDIRPEGERIKGFGGIASGAKALVELLIYANNLINERQGEQLTSVDVTDLMNYIGKTVIAGNVRRSAEISLGDADDTDFRLMKQDLDKLMSHRWASNNTVLIDQHFDDYDPIAEAVSKNGEPGIGNLYLARYFGRIIDGFNPEADVDVEGWNPCGEVTLENGENCNLIEIFPSKIVALGGSMNKILRLAVRYTKRVTFSNYDWEVTRNVIEKNRRIGVSISGIQDWVLTTFDAPIVKGWDSNNKPIYNMEIAAAFNAWYQLVAEADVEVSNEYGCKLSKKKTTVKPSGTVALLPGVSAGIHWNYADWQIKRIRFQANDPLVAVLRKGNYNIEPDVYSANTVVVDFYTKAPNVDKPNFKAACDVSIEEQIATQSFIQTYWADNSVSCTITFNADEKHKIAPLLREYKGSIKSTSMLPYSGHGYQQAPNEPISELEYTELSKFIMGKPQDIAQGNVDIKDAELIGSTDCASGVCPIR